MKVRSPIEQAVDRACGFDPNKPNTESVPDDFGRPTIDESSKVLLEVADAAVAWKRNKKKGEARLHKAIAKWKKILRWPD